MIKRYEESASGMIEDDEDGTYVDYFAYLELEAENEKLQEELNMLKGLLDELIDDIDSSDIGQAKKTLRRYGWG